MIAIEIQSFCPYRAGFPLHTNTQGAALGYELVGLSGRFAHPLRRRRSYGSPPRLRMVQWQFSKGPRRPESQAATENAPTGQQALSPGQRPGSVCIPYTRPERAKALCSFSFCPYRAGFPLHTYTQGVALGCELLALQAALHIPSVAVGVTAPLLGTDGPMAIL